MSFAQAGGSGLPAKDSGPVPAPWQARRMSTNVEDRRNAFSDEFTGPGRSAADFYKDNAQAIAELELEIALKKKAKLDTTMLEVDLGARRINLARQQDIKNSPLTQREGGPFTTGKPSTLVRHRGEKR